MVAPLEVYPSRGVVAPLEVCSARCVATPLEVRPSRRGTVKGWPIAAGGPGSEELDLVQRSCIRGERGSRASLRDGLDEVINGGGRAFGRGDLRDGVCGGEEGNAIAVVTCLGGWYVDAVVAVVVWSRADIPSVLAMVGPAGLVLLFFW